MKHTVAVIAAALIAGLGAIAGVASAASAIIEQAKDQCIVGEQADGYLGVVAGANASDAVRREVRDVNQQRKTYYADIARRNGVSVDVTARLTAEKLISADSRRNGRCVQDSSGRWTKV